jgi:beta-galactosidase
MLQGRFNLQHHPADHESTLPWGGAVLPPRAWYQSDCASISLDGPDWRFRFSERPGAVDFSGPSFDSGAWATITVPSHWVLEGYGKPLYTNLEYPFVVDPPRVPTDNPTGDYIRTFKLPTTWPLDGSVRPGAAEFCRG